MRNGPEVRREQLVPVSVDYGERKNLVRFGGKACRLGVKYPDSVQGVTVEGIAEIYVLVHALASSDEVPAASCPCPQAICATDVMVAFPSGGEER